MFPDIDYFDESKLFPQVKEHLAKIYCVKKMNQEIMQTINPLYCERMLTIQLEGTL